MVTAAAYSITGFLVICFFYRILEFSLFMRVMDDPIGGKISSVVFGYVISCFFSELLLNYVFKQSSLKEISLYYLIPARILGTLAYERGVMLRRTMESLDFVAKSSFFRLSLMMVGCAVFVCGGLSMAGIMGDPPKSHRLSESFEYTVGILTSIFFTICAFVVFWRMIKGGEILRISSNGIRSMRWSDQTIPWREIDDITWSSIGRSRFIENRSIHLHLRDPQIFGASAIGFFERSLARGDVTISLIGADCDFEDAMSAIARFRPSSPSSER